MNYKLTRLYYVISISLTLILVITNNNKLDDYNSYIQILEMDYSNSIEPLRMDFIYFLQLYDLFGLLILKLCSSIIGSNLTLILFQFLLPLIQFHYLLKILHQINPESNISAPISFLWINYPFVVIMNLHLFKQAIATSIILIFVYKTLPYQYSLYDDMSHEVTAKLKLEILFLALLILVSHQFGLLFLFSYSLVYIRKRKSMLPRRDSGHHNSSYRHIFDRFQNYTIPISFILFFNLGYIIRNYLILNLGIYRGFKVIQLSSYYHNFIYFKLDLTFGSYFEIYNTLVLLLAFNISIIAANYDYKYSLISFLFFISLLLNGWALPIFIPLSWLIPLIVSKAWKSQTEFRHNVINFVSRNDFYYFEGGYMIFLLCLPWEHLYIRSLGFVLIYGLMEINLRIKGSDKFVKLSIIFVSTMMMLYNIIILVYW